MVSNGRASGVESGSEYHMRSVTQDDVDAVPGKKVTLSKEMKQALEIIGLIVAIGIVIVLLTLPIVFYHTAVNMEENVRPRVH